MIILSLWIQSTLRQLCLRACTFTSVWEVFLWTYNYIYLKSKSNTMFHKKCMSICIYIYLYTHTHTGFFVSNWTTFRISLPLIQGSMGKRITSIYFSLKKLWTYHRLENIQCQIIDDEYVYLELKSKVICMEILK